MVIIENDGWKVILGHLYCGPSGKSNSTTGSLSISITARDLVSAGDIVDSSGMPGRSTGPHLYLEVRYCDRDGTCRVMNPNAAMLEHSMGNLL
jgi:murein DD-endopeptidase MepM/ murein hydrolase activator NlpD